MQTKRSYDTRQARRHCDEAEKDGRRGVIADRTDGAAPRQSVVRHMTLKSIRSMLAR